MCGGTRQRGGSVFHITVIPVFLFESPGCASGLLSPRRPSRAKFRPPRFLDNINTTCCIHTILYLRPVLPYNYKFLDFLTYYTNLQSCFVCPPWVMRQHDPPGCGGNSTPFVCPNPCAVNRSMANDLGSYFPRFRHGPAWQPMLAPNTPGQVTFIRGVGTPGPSLHAIFVPYSLVIKA